MAWTKREIISEAYGELALQGYEFDITPEEQQTALRRLDSMMAMWEGRGVRVNYPIPSDTVQTSLDQDTGLPDYAREPVFMALAVRLAAGMGKQVSPDTRRVAKEGYDTLLWRAAQPTEVQMPDTLGRGAGNKPWRTSGNVYFPPPITDPLRNTQGGDLTILE